MPRMRITNTKVAREMLLAACLNWLGVAACAGSVTFPVVDAEVQYFRENPSGLQIGFWAGYSHSPDVLRDFGQRPIERVNFHKWEQYESSPGELDFQRAFRSEQWAHLAGSTVITNVNTLFTHDLNPQGMHAMPGHVVPDITHPATRAAARRFLVRFVEELLAETGTAWLVLDYEMLWFARPTTRAIREAYRDWFVEAAGLARETANRLGLAERLKIGIVVNTDPFQSARMLLGAGAWPFHRPQQWLLDCVAAADFFAIDTYAGGRRGSVSADPQLRVMRFWIHHYAGDLPVYVTESGFSTSRQHGDTGRGYHIRGNEQEQAVFFQEMFEALERKNEDPYLSRVRGYCIWKYRDRATEPDLLERHFGIRHDAAEGTAKPALQVVADAIRRFESNPELAPVQQFGREKLTEPISTSNSVAMRRLSGTEYDVLRVEFGAPPMADGIFLEVETNSPVGIIAEVNGSHWITSHPDESSKHRLALPDLDSGHRVVIAVQVTGFRYPVETRITALRLVGE